MKRHIWIAGIFLILTVPKAYSGLILVEATADMSSGLSLATSLLPIGTTVTADVQLDIGEGTLSTANIDDVNGEFSWDDDMFGEQRFYAEQATIGTVNSNGWFVLEFGGDGPIINDIEASLFSIIFNIGINPFSIEGQTAQLFELIANSSIDRFRVGASNLTGLTQFGDLESNVAGVVIAVSEPNVLWLTVFGLFLVRRSSQKNLKRVTTAYRGHS